MKNTYITLFIALVLLQSCNIQKEQYRDYIDLSGQWQFALDSANVGVLKKWYLTNLNDSVYLPGTTDTNQKGIQNRDTTTMHLSRVYKYEGVAWYRKKITIPAGFKDKHIQLFLERTKPSKIWIDSTLVGNSHLLQSPQQFDVSDYLTPGEHTITICVNNNLKLTPYGNVHTYSDDTQTNWNGVLGKLYLEASAKTYISNLQIYPDIEKKKIDIQMEVENGLNLNKLQVEFYIEKTVNGKSTWLRSPKKTIEYQPKITQEFVLDDNCSLWDDYEQPLYRIIAIISSGGIKDSKSAVFGMRKFSVDGTQFSINGRKTFLRGKHDAAVFPLTGFPPMDVDSWRRVYKTAKTYGINHYRFHTYCPPEAAFTAADLEGIYLQAELPFWGGLDSDSVATMLREEGINMLKAYANHPSFVLFSHGNEIWSGHERVEKNIAAFKEYDSRPLYATGSNNNIGYVPPSRYADFFVAARTPYAHDTTLTHTRLTHAFADSRDGGILNTKLPSTEINFDSAVSRIKIPMISHEIGQYQIYPDYKEIDKYTGVLRAWNLEVFRNRLQKAGMLDMDSLFQQSSGAWSALCYKAEMEAALRTKGLAGFQLLDLQDFPGQGTALVGVLDAFMDSKNVVKPEEWRQSCNDIVLLLEFPTYCYTSNQNFKAKVMAVNYSNQILDKKVNWEIRSESGNIVSQGVLADMKITNIGIVPLGEINVPLSSVNKPEKLTTNVFIVGSKYVNSYPIWVYPPKTSVNLPDSIIVTEKMDNQIRTKLQGGANVLYFPQTKDVLKNSVPGLFPPEFWNYGMFKGISEWAKKPVSSGTLGLLMNPKHPIFRTFPTNFHTNWQWFSIVKASNSFILDSTPADYRPIVQVIDNLERNHKLGLLFEFKVGNGKLMVCMSRLNQLLDRPEAVQLYQSILDYMNSNSFNPQLQLKMEDLNKLFGWR